MKGHKQEHSTESSQRKQIAGSLPIFKLFLTDLFIYLHT
jgi:hypothetical protein